VYKYLLILSLVFGPLIASRADVTLELKADDGKHVRDLTTRIHGDKMRMDVEHETNAMVIIVDLVTRDSLTLVPDSKTYLKRSGAELLQVIEARRKSAGTNAAVMDAPAAPAVNTGKTEKVGGYDTEIYAWSGGRKLNETLWVAKDYPNYKLIQAELAKVDLYNRGGGHRNGQPELSLLPGMVVKSEIATDGQRGTNTLVAAKVEPVDASLFEVPADYTLWKPAPKSTSKSSTP